jgi:hypothetical protein
VYVNPRDLQDRESDRDQYDARIVSQRSGKSGGVHVADQQTELMSQSGPKKTDMGTFV